MSASQCFPEPSWLGNLPREEQEGYRLRFNIAMAALYARPDGSIIKFSEELGLPPTALSKAKTLMRLSPEVALKIEQRLGRELFPWECFLPALVLNLE